jgi:hypothetical protein
MPPDLRTSWWRLLLASGAALCIPAAIAVVVFVQGLAVLDAFDAARPCATPSRAAEADCLSLINGRLTDLVSAGRSNRDATVDFGDATVTVRISTPTSLRQGSDVVTEWWRGNLILLGPQGTSPTIITDLSPVQHLETYSFVLALMIPAISALTAGLLVLQAPMNADKLINESIARWPDPPRAVDRIVAWRVAWGGPAVGVAFFIWVFLYVFPGMIVILGTEQPRYAPWLLIATLVVSFGLPAVFAATWLSQLIRTSTRRTITVEKIKSGLGRASNNTKIWYALNDARVGTKVLDPAWDGHVSEGDHLDVLANPRSGEIWRMLSTPPA